MGGADPSIDLGTEINLQGVGPKKVDRVTLEGAKLFGREGLTCCVSGSAIAAHLSKRSWGHWTPS